MLLDKNEIFKVNNIVAPIFVIGILAMVTLPIPIFLLDIFFVFNIALSLVVLLNCIYLVRPLEFSTFPTILLVATLLRLALNVASTRIVLLYGHQGGDAAGKVIKSFGEVVIGGNFVVGLVVFCILIIINFIVITKGAGRISEVSARFTLDAMPGKQMAIDADLNAGIIGQEEAKSRREEIVQEADFYGAMDGASKFIRGDAVAGILILIINLIGGICIGVFQFDLSFSEAMERFSILTVGDGLVAQIPSLLLSTASAITVTRVSGEKDVSSQVASQINKAPQILILASLILLLIGIIPKMPHIPFLLLSAMLFTLSVYFKDKYKTNNVSIKSKNIEKSEVKESEIKEPETKELCWDDVKQVDVLGLEVGYKLIPLVDKNQEGTLIKRIKGVRKKLSQDLGFLVPSVHIRDNLELLPNAYRITLLGVSISEAEVHPDKELAINPGQVFGKLEGIESKDPAFGMDALWINKNNKDQAQALGYTVVDASTVIATHLNQIMHDHSHELLGYDTVEKLIDRISKSSPKLIEGLIPNPISLSTLSKILKNLLKERIPIRDIKTIMESLAESISKTQDTDILTSKIRIALSRLILQGISGEQSEISVIVFKPELEQILMQTVQKAKQMGGTESDAMIEPSLADKIQKLVIEAVNKQEVSGKPPIVLVASGIRSMLSKFLRFSMPTLNVLSYEEIPGNKKVTIEACISA